ncbi:MAG: hypothetical protein JO307_18905 [Bryobacterales bacterium]|nr:hypothetical protein [Bryobacterales bacterium]
MQLLAACVLLPPCAYVPVLVYYRPSTLSRYACSMRRALLLPVLLLPAAYPPWLLSASMSTSILPCSMLLHCGLSLLLLLLLLLRLGLLLPAA